MKKETQVDRKNIEKILENGVFYVRMSTSFDELDPLNMLHNSRYSYILERATFKYFNAIGVIPEFDFVKYPDLHHVVQSISLTYLKPIFSVTPFWVAISVDRVREAAVAFNVAFLSDDRETVYCRGHRVIAKVKPVTFEPVGWTALFRETHEFLAELGKKLK